MPSAAPPQAVVLNRRGASRWKSGHPWIYASDVQAPDSLVGGEVVRVLDEREHCLGQAFYSRDSRITLRRLTRDERPVDADFFARRIADAAALRKALLPGETTYRLIHGDGDHLPGLVVDRYGDYLAVQFLIPGTEQRRGLLTELLVAELGCRGVMNRSDPTVRALEGLPPDKGVLYGEVPDPVLIREGALTLAVSLHSGQKTGAFLDQRENHLLAGRYARGRALDCFSYAGGFALQMARRAEQVTAVDSSASACEHIRENAARNQLANVTAVCAKAFDFLKHEVQAGRRYDTIVLDPPAFAKNKASVAQGLRGYKELNLRALQLLNPGGCLISCSCSYHVDEAGFEAMLLAAAADAGRLPQVLERRGAGRDHPVLLGLPETRYLKCYVLRVD